MENAEFSLFLEPISIDKRSRHLVRPSDSKLSPLLAAHGNQPGRSEPFIETVDIPLFFEQGLVDKRSRRSVCSEAGMPVFEDSSTEVGAGDALPTKVRQKIEMSSKSGLELIVKICDEFNPPMGSAAPNVANKSANHTAPSLHEGENAYSSHDNLPQAAAGLNGKWEQGRIPDAAPSIIIDNSRGLMVGNHESQPQINVQKQIKEASEENSSDNGFADSLIGKTRRAPTQFKDPTLVAGTMMSDIDAGQISSVSQIYTIKDMADTSPGKLCSSMEKSETMGMHLFSTAPLQKANASFMANSDSLPAELVRPPCSAKPLKSIMKKLKGLKRHTPPSTKPYA
ncbi:hypothetical protein Nepgr_017245 [Nepenthes gracilis]|uniref:Uncharacterized protein n=1 Tax=Nepenthes gracilis TaxID=150966 RepID=A0AAD3XSX3_NEPGR|nr:hypothetical protein Nepgr_017245 [Nepenthes gracilis]